MTVKRRAGFNNLCYRKTPHSGRSSKNVDIIKLLETVTENKNKNSESSPTSITGLEDEDGDLQDVLNDPLMTVFSSKNLKTY